MKIYGLVLTLSAMTLFGISLPTYAISNIGNLSTQVDFEQYMTADYDLTQAQQDFGNSASGTWGLDQTSIPFFATFPDNVRTLDHNGDIVLEVSYPAGRVGGVSSNTFNTNEHYGGASVPIPFDQGYERVQFEFDVEFETGFDFGQQSASGKLNGLCSGTCTGNSGDSTESMNARFMRRDTADGNGARLVSYTYFPDMVLNRGGDFCRDTSSPCYGNDFPLLNDAPALVWDSVDKRVETEDGNAFTYNIRGGAYDSINGYNVVRVLSGDENSIIMDVTTNTVYGVADGRIRAYFNNELVLDISGFDFQGPDGTTELINRAQLTTFHGGSNASIYAPATDSFAYFDDMKAVDLCPLEGNSCDDNNPLTENDIYGSANPCLCTGTPVACAAQGGVGASCDDNNTATNTDTIQSDCSCGGIDCSGMVGGNAVMDQCNVCDTDPSNDCTQDCAGTYGGTSTVDACGTCGGTVTASMLASSQVCTGVCSPIIDACGVTTICTDVGGCADDGNACTQTSCSAQGICIDDSDADANNNVADCNGVCGGSDQEDICGACAGSQTDTTDIDNNNEYDVCEGLVLGCTSSTACNYNTAAGYDDGSCIYAAQYFDCNNVCTNDSDMDGTCDELEVNGCMDSTACNYDATVTDDDGSCKINDQCGVCGGDDSTCSDCAGTPHGNATTDICGMCNGTQTDTNDINSNNVYDVCEGLVLGCTSSTACNYNTAAGYDDGSCIYATQYYDCNNVCTNDSDMDGTCDELEVNGCMDSTACNYDATATNDATCTYAAQYYDCNNVCINDSDSDGVCDELEPTIIQNPISQSNNSAGGSSSGISNTQNTVFLDREIVQNHGVASIDSDIEVVQQNSQDLISTPIQGIVCDQSDYIQKRLSLLKENHSQDIVLPAVIKDVLNQNSILIIEDIIQRVRDTPVQQKNTEINKLVCKTQGFLGETTSKNKLLLSIIQHIEDTVISLSVGW